MRLTLCDDDGTVLENWYVPEGKPANAITKTIEQYIEVYTDRAEYEAVANEN